jgi:hypothetical protein
MTQNLKYKIGDYLWLNGTTAEWDCLVVVIQYQNDGQSSHPYLVRRYDGKSYGAEEWRLSYPTKLAKLLAGVDHV